MGILNIQLVVGPDGRTPTKAKPEDAAWDIYASHDWSCLPGSVNLIRTDLRMAIKPGWRGQLRARSGMASKGWDVRGGVIDASYRGEVIVCLYAPEWYAWKQVQEKSEGYEAHGDLAPGDWYKIKKGMRIAQMTLDEVPQVRWEEVGNLNDTDRGTGGFGHTGA